MPYVRRRGMRRRPMVRRPVRRVRRGRKYAPRPAVRRGLRAALNPMPIKCVKLMKYSQRLVFTPTANIATARWYCNAPSLTVALDNDNLNTATEQPMFWDQTVVPFYKLSSVLASTIRVDGVCTEGGQNVVFMLYRDDVVNPLTVATQTNAFGNLVQSWTTPLFDTSTDVEAILERPGCVVGYSAPQRPRVTLRHRWSCKGLDRAQNTTYTTTSIPNDPIGAALVPFRPAVQSAWRLVMTTASGSPFNPAVMPTVSVTIYYKCLLTGRNVQVPS